MSDLQIVLIVIGALIIFAVIVVNWWQERRFHQQVESSFSTLQSDALLDDPKLDASDLYEATEDPVLGEFAFDKTASEEKFSLDDALPEDLSIDDAYSQPADETIKQDYSPKSDIDLDSDATVKSAQHNDIKAIFNEAFSHKNKASSDNQIANYEALDAPANAAENHVAQTLPAYESAQELDLQEPVLSLPAMLHAQMDLTALLYLADLATVNDVASALVGLLDDYDKPVFVHVLDIDKQWHLLKDALPNQIITQIACSIQLADRSGPVSRHVLNHFQLAIETIGLDINAHVEWQSSGDAHTIAIALDAFCIEVDKTIGFHLTHGENGAFTGTKLRGLAESQGLTLTPDGVFKHFDEAVSKSQPSFVMLNRDDYPFSPEMLRSSVIKGVTFQLDIPHVKHCAEAFSHMVQVARQMEIGLNATLIDDNNKVLGDMQIEKIRQQLKVIHATMLVRGIVPGTDSAHRLFS